MTDAIKNQAIRMIEEKDLSGWSDAHDKVVLAALRAQPNIQNYPVKDISQPAHSKHAWGCKANAFGCCTCTKPDHSELVKELRMIVCTRNTGFDDAIFKAIAALEGKAIGETK